MLQLTHAQQRWLTMLSASLLYLLYHTEPRVGISQRDGNLTLETSLVLRPKYASMVSNTLRYCSYAFLPRPCYSYTAQQRLLTILTILTILTYLLTILTIWDIPHDAFSYGFTQCRRIPYGKYVW